MVKAAVDFPWLFSERRNGFEINGGARILSVLDLNLAISRVFNF